MTTALDTMPANAAFAHDALVYRGGAERVVSYWAQRWPDIPIFTSAYLRDDTFDTFRDARVTTSFLQRIAISPRFVMRVAFPLMVPGFRSFDFSGYDVVLSSNAYAAKTLRVPPGVCHVCYCYTPLRLAWRPQDYSQATGLTRVVGPLLRSISPVLRRWDRRVASRVFAYAATCRNVAERIKACYGREAEIIYAPVELSRYHLGTPDAYYLIVSRLNPYKRIDLAIEAARRLQRRLIIVGDGPQRRELEARAQGAKVEFLSRVDDGTLRDLYANCMALLFPQEEDYGLAPLEAQASGRPVIAYARGGALETVVDGVTGVFFHEQTADSLVRAIGHFESLALDPAVIRTHAQRFGVDAFCRAIESFVARNLDAFRRQESRSR